MTTNQPYATATSLLNADPDRIRKAVMKRFSPLDGIGQDLRTATSYDDAMKMSGLGFEPKAYAVQPTGVGKKKIPGYKALFNGDTDAPLSIVKEDYTVISNTEAFSIADDLVNQDGFQYEVSNLRKDGARCRLVLSGPNVQIGGEDYTPYAVLNNSFDLSKSVSVQFMFMRLVCLNGLMRVAPGIKSSITFTHFGDKDTKLQRLTKFRVNFEETLEYLQREASVLQSTDFTQDEFRKEIVPLVVDHVFHRDKNSPMPTDRQQNRMQSFIESVLSAYDADDIQAYHSTAYKVLLTMTDLDSHLSPLVNRNNPDLYINRVLQNEMQVSLANLVANYIIQTRHLKV